MTVDDGDQRHRGEDQRVANAIGESYLPRFAGDRIPSSPTGRALSVADRLDTLVGIFGIGQAPTGSKDPFALRRASNIHRQALDVHKEARAALKGQKPCVLWFTGLSGSGKSTIANLVEKKLHSLGRHTYILDGDNVRHGLNRDLGFTDADRVENIRRVGETAKLLVDVGMITLVSFISPFTSERRMAREMVEANEFIEIYVDTSLEECERRDVKGLYAKARAGEIKHFTGIDSAYEVPELADIHIDGNKTSAEQAAEQIVSILEQRGILRL